MKHNILAINHSQDIGGAYKSFRLAFSMLEKSVYVDNIFYINGNNKLKTINNKFPIPFDCSYLGSEMPKYKGLAYSLILYLKYLILSFHRILRLIKGSRIDIIYLNSYVLWPVLIFRAKNVKYIIHIREIIDRRKYPFITILSRHFIKKANAIICIDSISQKALSIKKAVIIRNPFNMELAINYRNREHEIREELGIPYDINIFSIIGRIEEVKGVDFLLEASEYISNIMILVIGSVTKGYGKACYLKYKNNNKVKFVPPDTNIEKYYAITHSIIRGESFLPLGRTVFEAIYSGCYAIIPKSDNDDIGEINDLINSSIYLYSARNLEDLIKTIEKVNKLERPRTTKYSNLDENFHDMEELIKSL